MKSSFISRVTRLFDNDFENNFENNAWNLEHNAEKLQEILNRIMQRIMSIITSFRKLKFLLQKFSKFFAASTTSDVPIISAVLIATQACRLQA